MALIDGMMGFSAMAAMMIAVMGVASLVILEVSDRRLRSGGRGIPTVQG